MSIHLHLVEPLQSRFPAIIGDTRAIGWGFREGLHGNLHRRVACLLGAMTVTQHLPATMAGLTSVFWRHTLVDNMPPRYT